MTGRSGSGFLFHVSLLAFSGHRTSVSLQLGPDLIVSRVKKKYCIIVQVSGSHPIYTKIDYFVPLLTLSEGSAELVMMMIRK